MVDDGAASRVARARLAVERGRLDDALREADTAEDNTRTNGLEWVNSVAEVLIETGVVAALAGAAETTVSVAGVPSARDRRAQAQPRARPKGPRAPGGRPQPALTARGAALSVRRARPLQCRRRGGPALGRRRPGPVRVAHLALDQVVVQPTGVLRRSSRSRACSSATALAGSTGGAASGGSPPPKSRLGSSSHAARPPRMNPRTSSHAFADVTVNSSALRSKKECGALS